MGYMKKNNLISKSSSARARRSSQASSGWARPIYINRHPQPPAKGTGFSGISQSLYTRVKIRLTAAGLWDIVGSMTYIKKGLDLTYLRGQVIALMKLSANIQSTINKLEEEIKEGENATRET